MPPKRFVPSLQTIAEANATRHYANIAGTRLQRQFQALLNAERRRKLNAVLRRRMLENPFPRGRWSHIRTNSAPVRRRTGGARASSSLRRRNRPNKVWLE